VGPSALGGAVSQGGGTACGWRGVAGSVVWRTVVARWRCYESMARDARREVDCACGV
jgi:hypothetical protein